MSPPLASVSVAVSAVHPGLIYSSIARAGMFRARRKSRLGELRDMPTLSQWFQPHQAAPDGLADASDLTQQDVEFRLLLNLQQLISLLMPGLTPLDEGVIHP